MLFISAFRLFIKPYVIQSAIASYLPQVQSNHTDAVVLVDLGVGCVLRVVNLRMDPLAFVSRVVDLSGLPLTLLTHRESHSTVNVRGITKAKIC